MAIATIALNFSILIPNIEPQQAQEEAAFQVISALSTTYLEHFHSPEAIYRTVVAIGNILWLDQQKTGSAKDLALALDTNSAMCSSLRRNKDRPQKMEEAVEECKRLLS